MMKNGNIIGKENLLQSAMLQTLRLIFFVKLQTTLNLRPSRLLDNVKGLDKKKWIEEDRKE